MERRKYPGATEGVSITTMIYAWTVTFNRELIDIDFLGVGFPLLLAYFHIHIHSFFFFLENGTISSNPRDSSPPLY
jgi:hypothetical protein